MQKSAPGSSFLFVGCALDQCALWSTAQGLSHPPRVPVYTLAFAARAHLLFMEHCKHAHETWEKFALKAQKHAHETPARNLH